MKQLFISFLLICLGITSMNAQNISSYFKDISKGDLSAISTKFSDEMEVCVYDTQEFMSKSEAIQAINNFLKDAKPISGAELHQGSSKSNSSQYRVGQLKTEKGNFRVFIYLEGTKNDFKVVSLLFNPE